MQPRFNAKDWITLADAARMAGRSYAWAAERGANGTFDRHPAAGGRRVLVSMQSVRAAIARDRRTDFSSVRTKLAGGPKRAGLRLVVDNTK